MPITENRPFIAFVVIVSLAFAWVVSPFYGSILWAVVAAIIFAPLNRRIAGAIPKWPNLAATITLLAIIAVVILPSAMIATSLVQEVVGLYQRIETREIDFARVLADIQRNLPGWATDMLQRLGMTDFNLMNEKFTSAIANVARTVATGAVDVGQSAFGFFIGLGVMLYLAFFLLRDGDLLIKTVGARIPLLPVQKGALLDKFTVVIRATIKGSVVVAILQGLIGGFIFWALDIRAALLGGVLMGFLSLLPAIGTGLIWAPVAIYLFVTGAVWEGTILVLCGLFVIGMVDNLLRPILVGKDTRMPDFVVLISTLGGIAIFGINGFILGPVIAALFMAAWDIFGQLPNGQRAGK